MLTRQAITKPLVCFKKKSKPLVLLQLFISSSCYRTEASLQQDTFEVDTSGVRDGQFNCPGVRAPFLSHNGALFLTPPVWNAHRARSPARTLRSRSALVPGFPLFVFGSARLDGSGRTCARPNNRLVCATAACGRARARIEKHRRGRARRLWRPRGFRDRER